MDGLTPQRDTGLSIGDVRPVQSAPALEAPERRVTQSRESSADSPDARQQQRDSIELSQEALELSLSEAENSPQFAGTEALNDREFGEALSELNADSLVEKPELTLGGELNPALPPVPFRSIQEGPDLSQPAQEGTGNEG